MKESYSSASEFPLKLLRHMHRLLVAIRPIHPQIIVTNKCQLNCKYCSCKKRDRTQEIRFQLLRDYIERLAQLGAKGVTLTGGGEPLLYPQFKETVELLLDENLKIGLVTNGIAMKKWPKHLFRAMDWIRISVDGHRTELPKIYKDVKVAYSWVYTRDADFGDPKLWDLVYQAKKGKSPYLLRSSPSN